MVQLMLRVVLADDCFPRLPQNAILVVLKTIIYGESHFVTFFQSLPSPPSSQAEASLGRYMYVST